MALRQRVSQRTRLNIQFRQVAIKASLTFSIVAIAALAVMNYKNEESFAATSNSKSWNQEAISPKAETTEKTETIISQPVKIDTEGMIVFRNSFSTQFYTDRTGDVSIQILGADGRVMFQCYQYALTGLNRFEFPGVSKLPEGEYRLRISHAGGENVVKIQHKI